MRNPDAIRPWQHVLCPLSGYLTLAAQQRTGAWNFGPAEDEAKPVSWVADALGVPWERDGGEHPHEARYLRLDSARARAELGWAPRWDLTAGLAATADWYAAQRDGGDPRELTLAQIDAFLAQLIGCATMRLLVLGGTVFLGRHVIDAALAAGHDVTAFSRGVSGAPPPTDVEWVRGDRDGGLGALGGRSWDAIVDTSGYVPRVVAQSFALEHGHYTFVSSGNVYADVSRPGVDESAPLLSLPVDHGEDVPAFYGPLKAECERVVDGALIVRSGLIAGAGDPTRRFTYWAARIADGGDVLAPGPPSAPLQLIDVRDTAEWIVRCAAAGVTGAFNVTGLPTTLGAVLEALPGSADLVWADGDWLAERGVEEWTDLPLWLALSKNPELAGFLALDVSKAVAAGLTFRPLAATAAAALAVPAAGPMKFGTETAPAGMSRERELELLREWRAAGS